MESKSALELAKKDPQHFLSHMVFQDLFVEAFRFARGTSGKLGDNMISQHLVMSINDDEKGKKLDKEIKLAIHLNCEVIPSALQDTITIRVNHFHITARSLAAQLLIDRNGPSILTADNSIHIGVDPEGWGVGKRFKNLEALAYEVGIDESTLQKKLVSVEDYDKPYMMFLVARFKEKVELRIHEHLRAGVDVTWEGDKSFCYEK